MWTVLDDARAAESAGFDYLGCGEHLFFHHATIDPIVAIDTDIASLQAQFVVFEVRGTQRPADGWPPGASGGQGTIRPIESGYYRISLRRTADGWRISENHTMVDLPPALPAT